MQIKLNKTMNWLNMIKEVYFKSGHNDAVQIILTACMQAQNQ